MHKRIRTHQPMNLYKPINAYGAIGDCHSVMLIAPNGSIDWGCLPDFDSPALFCRLLDEQRGGYFQVAPTSGTIPGTQCYLPGSNVLQTRFTSIAGAITLTDFMPVETVSAWPLRDMQQSSQAREDGSCHCLVRIVECIHGELSITARLRVTPDYASSPSETSLLPGPGVVVSGGGQHVGLAVIDERSPSPDPLAIEQEPGETHPTVVIQATLRKGERLCFALGIGRTALAARGLVEIGLRQRDFDRELAQTLQSWRAWAGGCSYTGPYSELVERSALVLKMMTYAPTGAIVAAPTTSLPEEIGGARNWDYR